MNPLPSQPTWEKLNHPWKSEELVLCLWLQCFPDQDPMGAWALLTGQRYSRLDAVLDLRPELRAMIHRARIESGAFRSQRKWHKHLSQYCDVTEDERTYRFDASGLLLPEPTPQGYPLHLRYLDYLRTGYPVRKRQYKPAPTGEYEVRFYDKGSCRFTLDAAICGLPCPPIPEAPDAPSGKPPVSFTLDDLIGAAVELDALLEWTDYGGEHFEKRARRIQMELVGCDQPIAADQVLTIEGIQHIIGMLGAGKSTLIHLLVFFLAQKGRHCTVVLNDVASCIRFANLLQAAGVQALPIIGQSGRKAHLRRLLQGSEDDSGSLPSLAKNRDSHRWLSTACPLSACVANEDLDKWDWMNPPCTSRLKPLRGDWGDAVRFDCPFLYHCPRHYASHIREAASVWLITPAAMVASCPSVTEHQLEMSWAERIYRRSDLVLFDEADHTQIELDINFCPTDELLATNRECWLNKLKSQVDQQDMESGHSLTDIGSRVDQWHTHLYALMTAIRRISSMLGYSDRDKLIGNDRIFKSRMLLLRLARRLSPEMREDEKRLEDFVSELEALHDRNSRDDGELGGLQQAWEDMLKESGKVLDQAHETLQSWLAKQADLDPQSLVQCCRQLEFAILLGWIEHHLNAVLRDWRDAAAVYQLDGITSTLHARKDRFQAVLPQFPMGNVLGFIYEKPRTGSGQPGNGTLKFLRAHGLGRELMLGFHRLFPAIEVPGPHVLLTSGTSWAPGSSHYHVPTPVLAVLRASREDESRIEAETVMRFEPVTAEDGSHLRVSGTYGPKRMLALKQVANALAIRRGIHGRAPSRLETMRDSLASQRRRVLLVVGSYAEAKEVQDALLNARPDWRGQVTALVNDHTEASSAAPGFILQRSRIASYSRMDPSWILIAPLLAVERGHNIVDPASGQAALGAVYFLVRPHPKPDDLDWAIHHIVSWAHDAWHMAPQGSDDGSLGAQADAFRTRAYKTGLRLFAETLRYSTLPDHQQLSFDWMMLVKLWQTIGRLLRGGVGAHVVFVDAAFYPPDPSSASLLHNMLERLASHFDQSRNSDPEAYLVRLLYRPLYDSLWRMLVEEPNPNSNSF